jgi:hypothetical protein
VRVGHRVAVHGAHDDAGEQRAQDRLQPEPLGQDDEPEQQHHGAPDTDLGGGVLQPLDDGAQ